MTDDCLTVAVGHAGGKTEASSAERLYVDQLIRGKTLQLFTLRVRSVQVMLGAQFAIQLETTFKRTILVVFPSIHPTNLASPGTALDRWHLADAHCPVEIAMATPGRQGMHDPYATAGEEEWVIWNGEHGLVTTATLGHVEVGPSGRRAWLDEPFDMVGPFSLDELETHGRIAFAACVVMSRQRWRDDQTDLRRESRNMRRAAQQRMNEEFARFSGTQSRYHGKRQPLDERQHREALDLPVNGKLERREINAAFRRLAQKAHPDVGGSHEQFVRITKARDVLLETV